jgi:hypothetical protein
MKMYYANAYTLTIEEREVVRQPEREPEGFGLRAIDPFFNAWFEDRNAAKDHLIEHVNREVNRCRMALMVANEGMVKVTLL